MGNIGNHCDSLNFQWWYEHVIVVALNVLNVLPSSQHAVMMQMGLMVGTCMHLNKSIIIILGYEL